MPIHYEERRGEAIPMTGRNVMGIASLRSQ
jgi:hypothetical protein